MRATCFTNEVEICLNPNSVDRHVFCFPGTVSHTEYCQRRGTQTGTGYMHMCATCALTTQLPDNRFPRFINEASCDSADCDCFTVEGTGEMWFLSYNWPLDMLQLLILLF